MCYTTNDGSVLWLLKEEGELVIEGLLNVFWGVRRPIRLQMQDEKETGRPRPTVTPLNAELDINTVKSDINNMITNVIEMYIALSCKKKHKT